MNNVEMDAIKLFRVLKDSVIDFKPDKKPCIICNKSDNSVLSTGNGREKIREAANMRNDVVTNRLNSLCKEAVFYYHMNNACYKQYCHKKSILTLQRAKERLENEKESTSQSTEEESPRKSGRRRARHHSPQAGVTSNRDHLCI